VDIGFNTLNLNTEPGTCYADIGASPPNIIDTCGSGSVSIVEIDPPEYWTYPFRAGVTTITVVVEDAFGFRGEDTATVTVNDIEAPQLRCPADLTIFGASSCGVNKVRYRMPIATDNCYACMLHASGPRSGDEVTTSATVSFEAYDHGGNMAACSFSINVVPDGEPDCTIDANDMDLDGDGFSVNDGDCCETVEECDLPELVNPGALEIENGIDDNCNGRVDEVIDESPRANQPWIINAPCDGIVNPHLRSERGEVLFDLHTRQAEMMLLAMGLGEAVEDDDDKSWGYRWYAPYHAHFTLANGERNPNELQAGVYKRFGGMSSRDGSMALLSTGVAREPGEWGYRGVSMDMGTVSEAPYRYIFEQTNQQLPYAAACPPSPVNPSVSDSVLFKVNLRQPTNMRGFAVDVLFGSETPDQRYPTTNQCDARQDIFLVMSSASGSPNDGNIAVDGAGNLFSNLNPSLDFWEQCIQFSDIGHCRLGGRGLRGLEYDGASHWHSIGSFARWGEEFSLDFVLFDGNDPSFDSFVLLDNFRLIAEERSDTNRGEMRVSDLQLAELRALPNNVQAGEAEQTVRLLWTIQNRGPDLAGDIFISYVPPIGTRHGGIFGDLTECSNLDSASASQNGNNILFRCTGYDALIQPGAMLSGYIELIVEQGFEGVITTRATVTSSSIDDYTHNNYRHATVMSD